MERALEGKRILVTGGGVRLGRALAEGLAEAGAHIAIHYYLSKEGAEVASAVIRNRGGHAQIVRADLTQAQEIEALVQEVESGLGPLDALVNGAAIFRRARFLETSPAELERLWETNARAPFLLTQAVVQRMWSRQRGDVINILDVGGALAAWRNYSAYCMTKAAMASLTQCLALELAPHIRVNGVAPGTILPPEGTPQAALDELRARIPQGRFGSPRDVLEAVLFLLTGPRFITGQILAVDGGRSISS